MSRVTTRQLAAAALFTALLSVSAYIAIPAGPVPFTLQVYVVVLAGMVLGPRVAALSVTAYLLLGLIIPVYSGGTSGVAILIGPTGGYLFGFVIAAMVSGLVVGGQTRGAPRLLLAGLAGLLPIYALGATWLALQLHLTPPAAAASGVLPFIGVDAVKAIAAALTARALFSLPLGFPAAARRAR